MLKKLCGFYSSITTAQTVYVQDIPHYSVYLITNRTFISFLAASENTDVKTVEKVLLLSEWMGRPKGFNLSLQTESR